MPVEGIVKVPYCVAKELLVHHLNGLSVVVDDSDILSAEVLDRTIYALVISEKNQILGSTQRTPGRVERLQLCSAGTRDWG